VHPDSYIYKLIEAYSIYLKQDDANQDSNIRKSGKNDGIQDSVIAKQETEGFSGHIITPF